VPAWLLTEGTVERMQHGTGISIQRSAAAAAAATVALAGMQ